VTLLPREEAIATVPSDIFERLRPGAEKAAWVEHFIFFIVGAWQRKLSSGLEGFSDRDRASFKDSLPDVQKAITPLVWRMRKGGNLNRGEGRWSSKCRETRTSMEGKYVEELDVLSAFDEMASLAVQREYMKAQLIYTKLTFGNKIWNSTHVAHVAAAL
jgi:hypothetical protein